MHGTEAPAVAPAAAEEAALPFCARSLTGRKRARDPAARGGASDLAPGSSGLEDEGGQSDDEEEAEAEMAIEADAAEVEVEGGMDDDDDRAAAAGRVLNA